MARATIAAILDKQNGGEVCGSIVLTLSADPMIKDIICYRGNVIVYSTVRIAPRTCAYIKHSYLEALPPGKGANAVDKVP